MVKDNLLIITSGKKYIDIDAYASMIAYRCLLQNLGFNAFAVSNSVLNESIPDFIKNLDYSLDNINCTTDCKYIVLDVSNPDFFDLIVKEEKMEEIVEHQVGYEDYWKEKNVKTEISFIGSVCTIVFERFQKANRIDLLDTNLCKLLIAGIIDNTLNLKSSVATNRDIEAYEKLLKIGNINSDYIREYFEACYLDIENNLEDMLVNDIKVEKVSGFLPDVIGQLIVLDINIILENLVRIRKVFEIYSDWILNVISLNEGKSYIFYNNKNVKDNFLKIFKCLDNNIYLEMNKCFLRKEIIKIAREKEASDGDD